jgi:hypothetical protein
VTLSELGQPGVIRIHVSNRIPNCQGRLRLPVRVVDRLICDMAPRFKVRDSVPPLPEVVPFLAPIGEREDGRQRVMGSGVSINIGPPRPSPTRWPDEGSVDVPNKDVGTFSLEYVL